MSRLPLYEVEDLPASLRTMHDDAEEENWQLRHVSRAFAPAPELLESLLGWYYPWHASDESVPARLPPRLKELVRLRLATFSGCVLCKSARLVPDDVPEDLAVEVDRHEDGSEYTPAEQAALRFAEKMALDHHSIGDADFLALRDHFDDAQVLELVIMTGLIYIGFGRALSVLQLDNISCPLPPKPAAV